MDPPAQINASIDPLLASLPDALLDFIEDQLSNNEDASDDALQALFVSNGLTSTQAAQAIRYRDLYLCNLFLRSHTPIRKNKHAIRFDPTRQQFVLFAM